MPAETGLLRHLEVAKGITWRREIDWTLDCEVQEIALAIARANLDARTTRVGGSRTCITKKSTRETAGTSHKRPCDVSTRWIVPQPNWQWPRQTLWLFPKTQDR